MRSCSILFGETAATGRSLHAVFGYFEAFAAAGMLENKTEGQLPITIRCSPVTRRGFLNAMEQGLGHKPTVEEVLAPLLEGGKLHDETVAAVRRDIETLTATKRNPKRAQETK